MNSRETQVLSMIERVARAIVTADEQNGGPPWDYLMRQGKHVVGPVYDRARAAIEEMREPTQDMRIIGSHALEPEVHLFIGDAGKVWWAMIGKALAE
jgi:hypothetical protein